MRGSPVHGSPVVSHHFRSVVQQNVPHLPRSLGIARISATCIVWVGRSPHAVDSMTITTLRSRAAMTW